MTHLGDIYETRLAYPGVETYPVLCLKARMGHESRKAPVGMSWDCMLCHLLLCPSSPSEEHSFEINSN